MTVVNQRRPPIARGGAGARADAADAHRFPLLCARPLDLDARPVVLAGPNGAGKTNLLEAVSFLAPGRGLRGATLAGVGRRGADGQPIGPWAVAAELACGSDSRALGTGPDPAQVEGRASGASCASTASPRRARPRSAS